MKQVVSLLALATACALTPAKAETTRCTEITSLPATITTQGAYCLHKDLSTNVNSGAAIEIKTNNVTLDCNGWKVGGLSAGISTNARGIYAWNRQNITIRNCGVRGFHIGINIGGGAGHLIEDNRVDNSTIIGMVLRGDAITARRNRIIDTGGRLDSAYSVGISLSGTGTSISDNQVVNVTVTGSSSGNGYVYGISFTGTGHEIARNQLINLIPAGAGGAYGTVGGGSGSSLRDNTAINSTPTNGWGFDGGSSGSQCRGNMSRGFTTVLEYCTDVSGNAGT